MRKSLSPIQQSPQSSFALSKWNVFNLRAALLWNSTRCHHEVHGARHLSYSKSGQNLNFWKQAPKFSTPTRSVFFSESKQRRRIWTPSCLTSSCKTAPLQTSPLIQLVMQNYMLVLAVLREGFCIKTGGYSASFFFLQAAAVAHTTQTTPALP